jgi:hypothetical protein
MHFYTNREAADAIAMKLHPDDPEKRAQAARQHWHAIHSALCDGELVGRDAVARLPMTRTGLVAAIAYADCLISETDLNDWLARLGVGIHVSSPIPAIEEGAAEMVPEEDTKAGNPASDKPTSAQLADALGPFLEGGRDRDWLETLLKDALRYPRLVRYRSMEQVGQRSIAKWEVGAVVLHLVGDEYLTKRSARAFLEQNYPDHLSVMEHMERSDQAPAASTWVSVIHRA